MTAQTATDRRAEHPHAAPGATIWLTGLPSAGKTTLARAVAQRLRDVGRAVEVLDGDEIRTNITAGLGFSREDRDTNVRRIGYVARLLARNDVLVLVPVIAPYAATRDGVRAAHGDGGHRGAAVPYIEIHVATELQTCEARDVKGLYAKQRAGELSGLTGVDDPYEVPADPDLRIHTERHSVEGAADVVLALLAERGLA